MRAASPQQCRCTFIALALLLLASPAAAAGNEDLAELRRLLVETQAQNRALMDRMNRIEQELRGQRARNGPLEPALAARPNGRRQPATPQTARTEPAAPQELPAPPLATRPRSVEERVQDLETNQAAQEGATRGIIAGALRGLGPAVNEFVSLSGAVEITSFRGRDFSGPARDRIGVGTAELDLDVRVNPWVRGNLLVAYDPGLSPLFQTVDGQATGLDRLTLDRAVVLVGDLDRFPLAFKAGRDVLRFGTSTGVARLDSLSLSGPLPTDAFESRQELIEIEFAFPSPALAALPPPVVIPPSRPMVIAPLIQSLAGRIGYNAALAAPGRLPATQAPPELPPIYGSMALFDSSAEFGTNRSVSQNVNASIGYRTRGTCGSNYEDLEGSWSCPWSFDVRLDYVSSLFDSRFLREEYRQFLPQIGQVPGVAATMRLSAGPFALVGELSGASGSATMVDDAGRRVRLNPAAWAASIAYQFDWNPWLEKIGEQGTFVALMYSGTSDMAGVQRSVNGAFTRVGTLPRTRVALTGGEWLTDNLKITAEISSNWDYAIREGGTGKQVLGFLTSLILTF